LFIAQRKSSDFPLQLIFFRAVRSSIARQRSETAPDRVIWGTDWPHPNVKQMPNDGDLVDFVPLFLPEPELQRRRLVENPAQLFEFEA
jgi:predicted TIM-barrel fold metal-dependent hydrolase